MASNNNLLSRRTNTLGSKADLKITTVNDVTNAEENSKEYNKNTNNSNGHINSSGKVMNNEENTEKDKVTYQKHKKGEIKKSSSAIQEKTTSSFRQMISSWRFVIALLLSYSLLVAQMPKFGMAVAVVCMVRPVPKQISDIAFNVSLNQTTNSPSLWTAVNVTSMNILNTSASSGMDSLEETSSSTYEFDWDSNTVGLILSAPYFTSFAGPLLSDFGRRKLGNKLFLSLCNGMSAALCCLSPLGARISPYVLVGLGCLQGILTTVQIPVISDTIAWWGPNNERLTLITIAMAGGNLAGIFSNVVSGYMCSIPVDNGWPFIFYTYGAIGALWTVLWCVFSARRPDDHPFVSEKELEYIVSNRKGLDESDTQVKESVPYFKIFTSPAVLGGILTCCCHFWFLVTTFTYIAIFFSRVLEFSVEDTGILMALVSVARLVGMFCWAAIANRLLASGLSVNKVRKICMSVGMFTAAASMFMIAALIVSVSRWVVIGLVFLAMLGQSVAAGILPNYPQDMAPRYAGVISGYMFAPASLLALSSPLVISALAPTNSLEEWQVLWVIFGVILTTCGASFLFLCQASIQSWANPKPSNIQNIVSPFANLGRRFSAFVEAPPLSPVSATSNWKFNFEISAKLATILPNLTTGGHVALQRMISSSIEESKQEITSAKGVEEATQTGNIFDLSVFSENSGDDNGVLNKAYEITEIQDVQIPGDGQRPLPSTMESEMGKNSDINNTGTIVNHDQSPSHDGLFITRL